MSRQNHMRGIVCALLALVTLLVYLPVRQYGFVDLDDPLYVTDNHIVQAGLTWTGIKWAFTTMAASNWHPLTWLSLMLDCQLFGVHAGWFHIVNVLFHAINTALLFLLLLRLTGALWPSAFIAALFGWHPLHVESVAWVAERKDVLSAFFGLLTLLAYVRCAQKRSSVEHRALGGGTSKSALGSRYWTRDYILALVFFALGLMAKPMLVTLPFVFLLLDYWPLRRVPGYKLRLSTGWRLVWEKWPFFVLAAVSCVVTFIAQKRGASVAALGAYPLSARLENAAVAYVEYLFKCVYPVNLAVFYPLPKEIPLTQVIGAVLVLAMITWLVWRTRASRPYLLVGWLWFLGMLVPVIGIVQVGLQAMADRYMYLPSIGVFMGVTLGLGELAKKWRLTPGVMILTTGIVLAGCLFTTARQLQCWRNSVTLFEHALAVTKDNPVAQNNLGLALSKRGHFQEAIEHLKEALRLEPNYAKAHDNLGIALAQKGYLTWAIGQFREALRSDPDSPKAHDNLGKALLQAGRPQEAIEQFREALRFEPDNTLARNNLAAALSRAGQLPEAIKQYRETLRLQPNFYQARYDLGLALMRTGQMEEAIAQFRTALQLQPDFAAARNQLGNALIVWGSVLFQKGQKHQALVALQEGLQIHPDNIAARNGLGFLFLKQGQAGKAAAEFQKVLELQPNNMEAQNNLAWILATCPETALRNGARAIELAERANQLSGSNNPAILATLAAAQAEIGHFTAAMATAQKAIALADSQNNTVMADSLRTQIGCYKKNAPFRDHSLTNTQTAIQ